jgi:hypothetical protein
MKRAAEVQDSTPSEGKIMYDCVLGIENDLDE